MVAMLAMAAAHSMAASHPPQRGGSTGAAVVSSMASIAKSIVLPVQSKIAVGWDEAKHATAYTAGVLHNLTSAHSDVGSRTRSGQESPSKQRPLPTRPPPARSDAARKPASTPRQQPRTGLAAQNRSLPQQHGSGQRGASPGAPTRWAHLPAEPPAPLPPPLILPPPRPPRPPPPSPPPRPTTAQPASIPKLEHGETGDPRAVHSALAKGSVASTPVSAPTSAPASAPMSARPRPTEATPGSAVLTAVRTNQTLVEAGSVASPEQGGDTRAAPATALPPSASAKKAY